MDSSTSSGNSRNNSAGKTPGTNANSIPRVLVVDDEPDLRELLELTLVRMGLDVDSAATVGEARGYLGQNTYALCLTDMRLPDASGMSLVEAIAADHPYTPVAVITAFGSADNAVAALKAGAFDYLSKPVELEQLRNLVHSAIRAYRKPGREMRDAERTSPSARGLKKQAEAAREKSGEKLIDRLLGESAAIREVRDLIRRVSRSQAPVSISGESGSGKELVARAIHDCSGRREGAFVAVNCGAIPEQLMEAEFFGYRKGAFTGADADRDGYFQTARGGTLFLDEVADLPLAMQVKLLRAIQERSVRRVGGMNEEPVDVRLISATHQDLSKRVSQGLFRQDLFYRLNVIDIRIPPLRERAEDVALLARHILEHVAPSLQLTPAALEKLSNYRFPGNVRELSNILERSAAFAETEAIDAADLQLPNAYSEPIDEGTRLMPAQALPPSSNSAASTAPAPEVEARSGDTITPDSTAFAEPAEPEVPMNVLGFRGTLPDHLDQIEKEIIERALLRTHYNRSAAAILLGITFRQMRYRMQRLNIQ